MNAPERFAHLLQAFFCDRSFIRYAGACEGPDMIAHTQRIMAIPIKRFERPMLGFLSANEMQAILEAIGNSWTGRRDHLLFLLLYKEKHFRFKPRPQLLQFLDSLDYAKSNAIPPVARFNDHQSKSCPATLNFA